MPVSIFLSREPGAKSLQRLAGTAAQPTGERVLILDDLLCAWRDARDRARVLKVRGYFVDRPLSAADIAEERGYLHQLADDVVAYLGQPDDADEASGGAAARRPEPRAAAALARSSGLAAPGAPVHAAPADDARGERRAGRARSAVRSPGRHARAREGEHQARGRALGGRRRHQAEAPPDEPARLARHDAPAPATDHLRVRVADGPDVRGSRAGATHRAAASAREAR